jgi:hypothetical protein
MQSLCSDHCSVAMPAPDPAPPPVVAVDTRWMLPVAIALIAGILIGFALAVAMSTGSSLGVVAEGRL